jgi:hypothetical protein
VFRAKDKVEFQIVKRPGHERSLVRRPAGAEEVCFNPSPRVSFHSTRGYPPALLRSRSESCNISYE